MEDGGFRAINGREQLNPNLQYTPLVLKQCCSDSIFNHIYWNYRNSCFPSSNKREKNGRQATVARCQQVNICCLHLILKAESSVGPQETALYQLNCYRFPWLKTGSTGWQKLLKSFHQRVNLESSERKFYILPLLKKKTLLCQVYIIWISIKSNWKK